VRVASHARRSRCSFVGVSAWLLSASPCLAEEGDAAVADALFRAGREAIELNDPETAFKRFKESYRLDPAAGTLLNLADCEIALGRLADAGEHYRRILDTLDPVDDRIPLVRDRLAALEPRIPKLELSLVSSAPPGTEVMRDGVRLTPASFGISLPQNVGQHELVFRSSGHLPSRYTLVLAEGETRHVVVAPGPAAAPPPVPPAPAPSSPHERAPESATPVAAYWLLGAGSAAAVATGVFAWRYAAESATVDRHCPTVHGCDDEGLRAAGLASFLETAAIATGITALVCIGGGLTLTWTAHRSPASQKSVRSAGVAWEARF
jgi:hypothetical protein